MGSSIGRIFTVTTFGESHGPAVGAVVDGCPPDVPLDLDALSAELDRRRPGQSALVSPRSEPDRFELLSGVFEGRTLGTPIAMVVRNTDARPESYEPLREVLRPSHADFATISRYGRRDWRGGGRASARETVGRVLGGAVARQVLAARAGVEIVGWVDGVGELRAEVDPATVSREAVESHSVRCPVPASAAAMAERIAEVRAEGDSIGGVVGCVARGVPAGLGDPVFDRLDADLAGALMSLPAAKAVSVGSGYASLGMRGSTHNDPFEPDGEGGVRTTTNHSGGIQGGISNGMPVRCEVVFKPVSTIPRSQRTVDTTGRPTNVRAGGRHDPCVVPRAVPIVEAMVAIVLCDHWLRWRAIAP